MAEEPDGRRGPAGNDRMRNQGGAERYPPARRDDAIEPRSFKPGRRDPAAPGEEHDIDADSSATMSVDHLGPRGDPAEGKR